ncbi:MAG: hypothetical protein JSV54_02910 [Chloroflexota bacterium]|nr:MAG: hypothetical protein JSV54_02910 [Chloroflexota bacterium]
MVLSPVWPPGEPDRGLKLTCSRRAVILGVVGRWILHPEDPWELVGYVHNVVFTWGAVPEDDGTLKLYWGVADKVTCAGTAIIDELVDLWLTDSRPPI